MIWVGLLVAAAAGRSEGPGAELEGFKGSATKGRFRKYGLTLCQPITTPTKQGKGVQQGSGVNEENVVQVDHGLLIPCRLDIFA